MFGFVFATLLAMLSAFGACGDYPITTKSNEMYYQAKLPDSLLRMQPMQSFVEHPLWSNPLLATQAARLPAVVRMPGIDTNLGFPRLVNDPVQSILFPPQRMPQQLTPVCVTPKPLAIITHFEDCTGMRGIVQVIRHQQIDVFPPCDAVSSVLRDFEQERRQSLMDSFKVRTNDELSKLMNSFRNDRDIPKLQVLLPTSVIRAAQPPFIAQAGGHPFYPVVFPTLCSASAMCYVSYLTTQRQSAASSFMLP